MESMYPTEVIRLPSYGKFYPAGHPLRENGGKLEIKYLTAKEEDILTNTNLMKNGQTVDKLLESIVVHEGVDYRDLTGSDIEAVLMFSRVISYGKDYEVTMVCNHCSEQVSEVIDLTKLEAPDEEEVVEPNPDGTLRFQVPSGKMVTIKVLTRQDSLEVDRQIESAVSKGLSPSLITSRLKKIIVDIDGVTDRAQLSSMIENMLVADTTEVRKQYDLMTPEVDTYIEITCSNCGKITGGEMPITAQFFWPNL